MDNPSDNRGYAHLPEDLIKKILDATPDSAKQLTKMFAANEEQLQKGMEQIRNQGLVKRLEAREATSSVIAVDGGCVMERLNGADLLLVVAVGVEGLQPPATEGGWRDKNQFYQWQAVLPHDEATARLMQGAMFLMELSVLAGADYDIKIMDGAHFTPILKINSMLSANEDSAGKEYTAALRRFLRETYKKVIPHIPDIFAKALRDEGIVAMAKYSSSRDLLESLNLNLNIRLDDKTFFTKGLKENEYTRPMSVGQSAEERRKIWDELHIRCNLEISERDELNKKFKEILAAIRTKDGAQKKESDLYFTYFKPYANGPAYRIECKKALAKDDKKMQETLASIKKQIVNPDMQEPFPQYLADMMAKSVAGGLHAMQEAIRFQVKLEDLSLIFPYRSNNR